METIHLRFRLAKCPQGALPEFGADQMGGHEELGSEPHGFFFA